MSKQISVIDAIRISTIMQSRFTRAIIEAIVAMGKNAEGHYFDSALLIERIEGQFRLKPEEIGKEWDSLIEFFNL